MKNTDPLVPVLTSLVVDVMWWLDSYDDTDDDLDAAVVSMMDSVAWTIGQLPFEQQERLLGVLHEPANAEENPARREQLRSFPAAVGLAEEPPSGE
ncbi:hypothetical protein [Nocardia sp. NPDC004711]